MQNEQFIDFKKEITMALHKKRERTQNWTPEEKKLLLKLCGNKINILESKKADQYSLTIKTNVWKDIHKEFTSKLGSDRDILRLKEQWQRMKKQARSELQDYKCRAKKQGDHQMIHLKKISNISQEVLKIMDIANKNNNEEDESFLSSDNTEQDNIPTYFCETEVKQEQDDDTDDNNIFIEQRNKEDSENSLSPITNLLNYQSKQNKLNKQNAVLNVLTNICQNQQNINDDENIKINKNKRKFTNDVEEFQLLQTLFESKHKEHQKRMIIFEEQIKTAKLQRETAEIQKQIAQQELKQMLLHTKEKKNDPVISAANFQVNSFQDNNKNDIVNKIQFHQNQIKYHVEEIDRHKQQMDEIIKKER